MKNKSLKSAEFVELDANELSQVNGGFVNLLVLAVGSYLLYQVASNPKASYEAFMEGWNSF